MEKQNFNVRINSEIFNILKSDGENFEIKSLNKLINDVFYSYINSSTDTDICERVWKKLLLKNNYSKKQLNEINDILQEEVYPSINLKRNANEQLNFRLSQENLDLYNSLEKGADYVDSVFFRKIFEWYVKKPKYKREQILHMSLVTQLKKAIEKRRKITLNTKTGLKFESYPYGIIIPKEENFSYLLTTNEEGKINTIRISKIKKAITKFSSYSISDELEKKLSLKLKNRNITFGEAEEIELILTEVGYNLMKRISHNKPEYRFSCIEEEKGEKKYRLRYYTTLDRIRFYFLSFGKECEIVFPISLKEEFKDFYEVASKSYD